MDQELYAEPGAVLLRLLHLAGVYASHVSSGGYYTSLAYQLVGFFQQDKVFHINDCISTSYYVCLSCAVSIDPVQYRHFQCACAASVGLQTYCESCRN